MSLTTVRRPQTGEKPSTRVITGKVRLSYCNLFRPVTFGNNEPKYSVSVLIPKTDTETLQKIENAMQAAIQEGAAKGMFSRKPSLSDGPLKDGDRTDDVNYKNHMFVSARSKYAPNIVDKNRDPILDENEVYSGCYARVSLVFYPYNHPLRKGVGCALGNVQKLADGEPLVARIGAEEFDIEDDNDLFGDDEAF